MGKIDEQMIEVTPVYEPTTSGANEKAFISKVKPAGFSSKLCYLLALLAAVLETQ